jgi:hypothetical protein
MNQELIAVLYFFIGLLGAYAHYFKKRYVENLTTDSLDTYIFGNYPHTVYMLGGLAFAEMTLAAMHPDVFTPTLSDYIGALTAGFVADSGINKASDAK